MVKGATGSWNLVPSLKPSFRELGHRGGTRNLIVVTAYSGQMEQLSNTSS